MNEKPKIIKNKVAGGWYVKWYGIMIYFTPPDTETITGEYYPPRLSVCNINPEKPVISLELDLEE